MVLLHPGLLTENRQKKMLESYTDPKQYTYALMEMMWLCDVLATHSLAGKASNAFKDRSPKPCLDIEKTADLCGV